MLCYIALFNMYRFCLYLHLLHLEISHTNQLVYPCPERNMFLIYSMRNFSYMYCLLCHQMDVVLIADFEIDCFGKVFYSMIHHGG